MNLLLLIVGVLLLAIVAVTFVPIRRDPLTGTAFVVGWLTGELAGQLIVVDLVIVSLLMWAHGASHRMGRIGLALDTVALVGLVVLGIIGRRARSVVASSLAATPGMPIDLDSDALRPRWGRWWRVMRGVPLPKRSTVTRRLCASVVRIGGRLRGRCGGQ